MNPTPGYTGREVVARGLADAFLSGAWTLDGLRDRGAAVLGARPRWLGRLTRDVLAYYRDPPRDRPRELAAIIAASPSFRGAFARADRGERPRPRVVAWTPSPTRMGPRRWPVPALDTVADLAGLLGTDLSRLLWLADPQQRERRVRDTWLRNYHYRWRDKPSGGVRLLESPKLMLKQLQRRTLHEILARIPAHPAAHGFVPGRSVRTFAGPHAGREVLVRLDLEGFFPTVSARRVYGIFRTAGYPEPVGWLLTALCVNAAPVAVLGTPGRDGAAPAGRMRRRLAEPHLPQGAPTSPALANLACHRLDRRLAGLAAARGATYTRYADDLAFSGDRAVRPYALARAVRAIVVEEGFDLNDAKTSVAGHGERQLLGGLVVNDRVNVPRWEVDRLRAVVHNCVRDGPEGQNRDGLPDFRGHLLGRIAWVEAANPDRGRALRALFDRIAW